MIDGLPRSRLPAVPPEDMNNLAMLSQTDPHCPRCGSPLSEAGGLCARCALGAAFGEDGLDEDSRRLQSELDERHAGLPGYLVLRFVARGGMGMVYKARHVESGRMVALKIQPAIDSRNERAAKRFEAEARAVDGIEHPNIVSVRDACRWNGRPFLVTDWVDGAGLDVWAAQRRAAIAVLKTSRRDEAQADMCRKAAEILAVVARAVSWLHDAGIVHRDLKPSNILIDRSGAPHVSDFGVAGRLAASDRLTWTGEIVGTPDFMSPEQVRGELHGGSVSGDIFSLGAVLYWILAERPPFAGGSVMASLKKLEGPEEAVSISREGRRVDRDLEEIALKCLRKDHAARYGTATDLAEDLERWLAGTPIVARPRTLVERLTGRRSFPR